MKRQLFLIILPILFFMACRHDPKPRNAIEREKYVDVLVDIHLAEGLYRDRVRFKMDTLESSALYLAVLDKHSVTHEQMSLTALYYSRHPREYDRVFSDVLSKISILIEENQAEIKPEEINIDSTQPLRRE